MSRKKNFERGAKGEERIRTLLEEFANVYETPGRYPDLLMKLNGTNYGVECKTVKSVHSFNNGHRMGCLKISAQEMAAMNQLTEQDMTPCLIVEIRPTKGGQTKSYFYIPWEKVKEKYARTTPQMLTLRFYDILNMGLNLRAWLQRHMEDAA